MDILQIFVTTGTICIVALIVGLFIISKFKTLTSDKPSYTQEEITNIKLAEELYNKDARYSAVKYDAANPTLDSSIIEPPIAQKEPKTEFPIDKPKKKRKYYPKKPKTNI